MASLVELLPVFPMTLILAPKQFTVWPMSIMCSSQLISWPSPVVPPTITPSAPLIIWVLTSSSYASRSNLPSGRYGVLMAVITLRDLMSSVFVLQTRKGRDINENTSGR